MIQSLHVRGYRSLRDFRLSLGRVTVITGENGTGKSNLYRSLRLLQRAAEGRFAEAIAREGGMPGVMWAGERRKDEPRGVSWAMVHADFRFALACGLCPAEERSRFRTDPDIKSETLRHGGEKGRVLAKREGPLIQLRTPEGAMESFPLPVHAPESMLSEIRHSARFPALAAARETLLGWRFYHQFRTDADAPARRPRIGAWSPVLAHEGENLAAAWQSIAESGHRETLDQAIDAAFPGSQWRAVDDAGGFQMQISRPGLNRWLAASELSDGTLRYFCLCAALLTPKPPPLLVINEPETSMHPGLLDPLADLVAKVPEETQLLLVTHSQPLAEAVADRTDSKRTRLIHHLGETRLEAQGTARRAWVFDDPDE